MADYGCQDMFSPIKRVIVREPNEAFANADPGVWHYTEKPDLEKSRMEHEALVRKLIGAGIEVIHNREQDNTLADSIFVHDPAIISDRGAIILKMGKKQRQGEEALMARKLKELEIPIIHQIDGNGRAEGGDMLWIDSKTLAVGIGFRTNREGFMQIKQVFEDTPVDIIPVELPYYTGPDACLHLLSLISIVDKNLAVVYLPLMPVSFFNLLSDKNFRFIEVSEKEFLTMGTNVLALAPGKCLTLENNRETIESLRQSGCEVLTYKGEEISLKAEGGPTCLTRPILREYTR